MARANLNTSPIIRKTDTIIYDANGDEVIRLTMEEITIWHPDGTIEVYKHHDNINLADGSSWNVNMLFAKPPVYLGVCDLCRHKPPYTFPFRTKPSCGLVRLTKAKLCSCGALTCPKHHRRCRDGTWRCTRCARCHTLKMFCMRLFFVRRLEA